jgi:MFS family permease
MRIEPHIRQYFAVFLFDLSMVAGLTIAPFYVMDQLGGEAAMMGLVTGAQWGMYALVCLVSGPHVTRAKNGLVWAVIGVAGFATLFPLSALVKNPVYFTAMTTAALGCTGLFWPAMQAWIGAIPDPVLRRRRMSVYNLAWTAGLTLAPLVAGPLYAWDYRAVFPLIFLAGVGTVALILSLPHEKKHFGEVTQELRDAHAHHDSASEAHLYMAWCSILIGCVFVAAVTAIFAKRVDELADANQLVMWFREGSEPLRRKAVWYFSWLVFVLFAFRAVASVVMGLTHVWQHKFWILAALQIASGAAFWVMAHTTSLVVMAGCCVVVGLCSGACFFASQTYSVVDPAHKHRRLTVHEGMIGVGCVLGAVGYGLLADQFGTPWPFAVTPVFVAVGLAIQAALLRYGYRRQQRLQLVEEES